jgi:hypothetical protein
MMSLSTSDRVGIDERISEPLQIQRPGTTEEAGRDSRPLAARNVSTVPAAELHATKHEQWSNREENKKQGKEDRFQSGREASLYLESLLEVSMRMGHWQRSEIRQENRSKGTHIRRSRKDG